jgi:hypothetical protein
MDEFMAGQRTNNQMTSELEYKNLRIKKLTEGVNHGIIAKRKR